MRRFELDLTVKDSNYIAYNNLMDSLVKIGIVKEIHIESISSVNFDALPDHMKSNDPFGSNARFKNMPLDSALESAAKEYLGICEPKKDWKKQLKEAVDQHGHDAVLDSFIAWAESLSGSFMGRKPMDMFFKNIGQRIIASKPTVTNANLDKMEKGVAICTDNKVFFTGEYRVRLALLLKEYGLQLVSQAFAEFWQSVDDKGIPWAHRDFLQQAAVRINTIKEKEKQALIRAQSVAKAYDLAKSNIDQEPEEDEEL